MSANANTARCARCSRKSYQPKDAQPRLASQQRSRSRPAGQVQWAKLSRATDALFVALLPATATVIGVMTASISSAFAIE